MAASPRNNKKMAIIKLHFTLKSGFKWGIKQYYLQCKCARAHTHTSYPCCVVIWQAFNAFTPSRHRHSGQSDRCAWNIHLSDILKINISYRWALDNSSLQVPLRSCQKCPSFRNCARTVRWSVLHNKRTQAFGDKLNIMYDLLTFSLLLEQMHVTNFNTNVKRKIHKSM